jgi:hypothetical protein
MNRRELIALLGGTAATGPLGARAQQSERMRRIGMLSSLTESDPEEIARKAAFVQVLAQKRDWTVTKHGAMEDLSRVQRVLGICDQASSAITF